MGNFSKENLLKISPASLLTRCLYAFLFVLILLTPASAFAHPGRTDSSGCHTCRTNCPSWGLSTGEYHCHNAKALPQPEDPIRSHYGPDGTGTTEPWPAYRSPSSYPLLAPSISTPKTTTVKPSAPVSASSLTYTLFRGTQNSQVTRLQQILEKDPSVYPEGLVTGYFGPATERAVMRFQKKYGLEQVGYAGPKTRMLLNSL